MPKHKRNKKQLKSARKSLIKAMAKEFDKLFPTKASQMIALGAICNSRSFDKKNENILVCYKCDSSSVFQTDNYRALKCTDCKQKTWITSGTVFEGIKKPRPWLLAVWFYENGITLNSPELAMIGDIVPAAAWELLKKLALFINTNLKGEMEDLPVDLFSTAVCKRSRLSRSGQHPKADLENSLQMENDSKTKNAEIAFQEANTEQMREKLNGLAPQEKEILDLLGSTPTQFEDIFQALKLRVSQMQSALLILEIEDLIKTLPGDHYILSEALSSYLSEENGIVTESRSKNDCVVNYNQFKGSVSSVCEYIKDTFRGISRKYLEPTISLSFIESNKLVVDFAEIFREMGRKHKITSEVLRAFNTPSNLKIPKAYLIQEPT